LLPLNMDRKGIIGMALAVVGLVLWQIYYTRETQRVVRAQEEANRQAAAAAARAAPVTQPPVLTAPPVEAVAATRPDDAVAPAEPVLAEKIEKLASSSVEYSFTNRGGGIASARLLRHVAEKDARVVLNEFGSIPIGAVTEAAGVAGDEPFEATPSGDQITFVRTDARQLQTTKKFILPKLEGLDDKAKLREEYLVQFELTFANRGANPLRSNGYYVHTGSAAPIHRADLPTYTGFNWLRGASNKFIDVNWFNAGGFLVSRHPERLVYTESYDRIGWAGVTNQYFTSLVTSLVDEKASADVQQRQTGSSVWARRLTVSDEAWRAHGHSSENGGVTRFGVDGALGMRGFSLEPGASFTQSFNLYIGPREYRRLAALGHNEDQIMDFGVFGIVSRTLLTSMNVLRAWFGNYAWAIVVLTLIIKTAMWPLQNKATNSMKKMQALQPKMAELREKYKDDPTRMNSELMRLYKEYGINPFGGCLPMLVQIPIFFGFYNMLGKAVELRNARFLWVHDLSQPDTVARILAIPINPLPLLMAVTMFWQMAISPKSGDPMQQRVFMFMPLIFIFFCYNFASALALYWTVQNLFSVVQLYVTRNQAPPTLQKVTAPAKKKSRS
jgi:YidC/Oxa1 family membrane protein insertase